MTYIHNPVDTARPTATFGNVLRAVAADPGVDGVLVFLVREAGVDIPNVLGGAKASMSKPMVMGSGGLKDDIADDFERLRNHGVPAFASPERAANAMCALVEDSRNTYGVLRRAAPATGHNLPPLGSAPLDEAAAKALLQQYGIRIPQVASAPTARRRRPRSPGLPSLSW